MKIYCAVLINELTGDLEHCITSDNVISDSMIPEPDAAASEIKTIPPTPLTTWRKSYCEFNSVAFTSGRDVLDDFEVEGATLEKRLLPDAKIRIKAGITTYSEFKETNERIMRQEHEARL